VTEQTVKEEENAELFIM